MCDDATSVIADQRSFLLCAMADREHTHGLQPKSDGPSSVCAPSSNARSPVRSFLLLIAMASNLEAMATTWPPRCVSQAWPCPDLELRHDHLTSSDVVALIEDKQKRKSMNPKRKFLPSDCFSSLPTRRSLRSVFCEAITSWLKLSCGMLRKCFATAVLCFLGKTGLQRAQERLKRVAIQHQATHGL